MDTNNYAAHAQLPVQGEEAAAAGAAGDWRSQLKPESRQRIVLGIMETLKRHLPFSGQEGLQELRKIAVRFEEKIYTAATSQHDYLRKISLKLLTMESKSQDPVLNTSQATNANTQAQLPVQGKEAAATSATGAVGDWRSQLQPESRQRIVLKIMEALKPRLPFSGQEGLLELRKIAVRFEEKILTTATSQQDYLRKASLKLLAMQSKYQNPMPNTTQAANANSERESHRFM